jgi:hypothetical protein
MRDDFQKILGEFHVPPILHMTLKLNFIKFIKNSSWYKQCANGKHRFYEDPYLHLKKIQYGIYFSKYSLLPNGNWGAL